MKTPTITKVVRILLLIQGLIWVFVICGWAIFDAYFPTEEVLLKHPNPDDPFYMFNKTLAFISPFIGIFHFWMAKKLFRPHGSKRSWIVVLLMYIFYSIIAPIPISLPVLFIWCSKTNKKYHFEPAH